MIQATTFFIVLMTASFAYLLCVFVVRILIYFSTPASVVRRKGTHERTQRCQHPGWCNWPNKNPKLSQPFLGCVRRLEWLALSDPASFTAATEKINFNLLRRFISGAEKTILQFQRTLSGWARECAWRFADDGCRQMPQWSPFTRSRPAASLIASNNFSLNFSFLFFLPFFSSCDEKNL